MRIYGPEAPDGDFMAVPGPDGVFLLLPLDASELEDPGHASPLPINEKLNAQDRNSRLREHLAAVAPLLRTSSRWATCETPYTSLLEDCRRVMEQPLVAASVRRYLREQPSVRSAADMLITAMAMAARANWRDTPAAVRATAARGWFLARWLPTFLIVDGPISRFLTSPVFRDQNPRADVLRDAKRLLCNEPILARVRNAFAHWSFGWEVIGGDSEIVIFDERTGSEVQRLHRRQGDAIHMIAFSIVDILNETMFSRA